jgi:hypothetical protein
MGQCMSCSYYKPESAECRRNAPVPMGYRQSAHWPRVKETDGCGEFVAANALQCASDNDIVTFAAKQ